MQVKAFPNPTQGQFLLDVYLPDGAPSGNELGIAIYNTTGSVIWQKNSTEMVSNLRIQVDGTAWTPGVYAACIRWNGQEQWVKMVVER